MATYEGGDAQGAPGRRAAGLAGGRPLPRLRDHGSVAGRQRRATQSSDRHRLPGAAPARAGGAGEGHLVASGRAPPPRLPADRGRSPRARSRARSMAPVLRRDDEPAGSGTAAADLMTPPPRRTRAVTAYPRSATGRVIEPYLAELAAALPGPAGARAGILAELRAGLLDAADAHHRAGLADPPPPRCCGLPHRRMDGGGHPGRHRTADPLAPRPAPPRSDSGSPGRVRLRRRRHDPLTAARPSTGAGIRHARHHPRRDSRNRQHDQALTRQTDRAPVPSHPSLARLTGSLGSLDSLHVSRDNEDSHHPSFGVPDLAKVLRLGYTAGLLGLGVRFEPA